MTFGEDFSALRILVPLPPRAFFGGLDAVFTRVGIKELRNLGAAVETISAEDWADLRRRSDTVAKVREFAPDFVIGIPNAGYPLYFMESGAESRERINLFADVLSIPVVLPWDHLLTQAPGYYLGRDLFELPARRGALESLRRGLAKPLSRHYVPDSGHAEIYEKFGLLSSGQASRYIPPGQRHFVDAGRIAPMPTVKGRAGFAGNIYTASGARLEILQYPLVREIDEALSQVKRQHWTVAGWTVYCQLLEQVPAELRELAALTPDYNVFWRVALELLSYRVGTAFRLSVLGAVKYPIDFYGNFTDPESSQSLEGSETIRFCGNVDYLTELPTLFRNYEIWVDATNAPFIRGCGHKVLNCFAAGSLMLIDFREDLREELGPIAERFMYHDAGELNEKLGYYFGHPKERLELVAAMQTIIRERLTYQQYFQRICADMTTELRSRPEPVDSR